MFVGFRSRNDAALVRVVDRGANPAEQLQALPPGDVLLLHVLGERYTLDQFHGEVVLTVVRQPGFVNGSDRGVPQPRQGLSLPLEEPDVGFVHADAAADDLDGHRTLRLLLHRLVNDPHAALAQQPLDAIGADAFRQRSQRGEMCSLHRTDASAQAFRALAAGRAGGQVFCQLGRATVNGAPEPLLGNVTAHIVAPRGFPQGYCLRFGTASCLHSR